MVYDKSTSFRLLITKVAPTMSQSKSLSNPTVPLTPPVTQHKQELLSPTVVTNAIPQPMSGDPALPCPDVILLLDRYGVCREYLTEHALGATQLRDACVGHTVTELFGAAPAQVLHHYNRQLFATQQAQSGQLTLTVSGKPVLFAARFTYCGINRALVVLRDVTVPIHLPQGPPMPATGPTVPQDLSMPLVDAIPQGIMLVDCLAPDAPLVYINPGFTHLTGYAAAEVIGRNDRLLHGPATDPATVAQLQQAIQRRESCVVDLLAYRKDGSTFWSALAVVPLYNGTSDVTHYVGVYTDITPLKQAEVQLQQAQKMESIGLLASGIAHDFNNILTVIQGHCEMLRRQPLTSFMGKQVAQIQEASDRGAALVHQLLLFSRKQERTAAVLDLNGVMIRMKTMLTRLIGDDILIRIQPAPQQPRIKIDPAQLEQVLMNLAVNARDAMPHGGMLTIRIQVAALPSALVSSRGPLGALRALPADYQPGSYVQISVLDTGVGMDEQTKQQIFDPFFTTKPAGKGTGLGLATVYGIIVQNGGLIEVESEVGRGTAFHLWFPQALEPVNSAPMCDVAMAPATGAAPASHPMATILVVEDDDQIRTLVTFILEENGYTTLAATNLREAVYLVETTAAPPDLLVTDLSLPGGSGIELYTTLIARYPTLKVLFVSGYSEQEIRQQHAAVITHFLSKPFTLDALVYKVHEVLATPPAPQASTRAAD